MVKLLSQIKVGKSVRVKGISNSLESKGTLLGIGVLPGDILVVSGKSFFGSPISIKRSNGDLFALRRKQASFIEVEEIY